MVTKTCGLYPASKLGRPASIRLPDDRPEPFRDVLAIAERSSRVCFAEHQVASSDIAWPRKRPLVNRSCAICVPPHALHRTG